jgi:6,7-dimethyl-8-ribityllumazine synthase
MSTFEIEIQGESRRIAVVVSRFNHLVVKRLLDACLQRLKDAGCKEVDVFWVPGAVEIPLAAQTAARTGRYDAIVAIGAVIRGETGHYDEVCRAVTEGVRQVVLAEEVPVGFGVLTTENAEQALARATILGEEGRNHGRDAAEAALEMVGLLAAVRSGS